MEVELTHRVPPAPAAPAPPLHAPRRDVIEHLRAVLSEDPHDLDALGRLGDAQLADHDPDGALRTAVTAIALAPDRELGHRQASIACSRRGRHREAIAHAEDAVRLAPAEPSAFLALARALLRAKRDLERARRAAVRAMVIAPEASEPHLVFGMVAAAEGEQAAAEAAFRRAVQLHPGNMAARNELARLELRRAVQRGVGRAAGPVTTVSEARRSGPSIGSSRGRVDEMKQALHMRLRARRATASPVAR